MKRLYFKHIAAAAVWIFCGLTAVSCATTQPAPMPETAAAAQTGAAMPEASAPAAKTAADIEPILQHIAAATAENPQPVIASGVGDGGVWVEGSGIFSGTLDQVFGDLSDPLVIGPVHMTKNITADNFQTAQLRTTYVMHVKMRYILSVEFDLSARIEPFFDAGGNQIGWTYLSEKTAGSRFLTKVTTKLTIEAVGPNAFRVDFRSENVASMNKEAEARKHLETLFDYWKTQSETRAKPETSGT